MKAQKEMALIQPKIREIQKKYKNDKEKQAQATMELYKEHQVNPFSGCLPLLIQLPILIAFFQVLRTGLDPSRLNDLYWFVKNPGLIDPMFLGLVDLAKHSVILAVLAGAAQFIQSKMTLPAASSQKGQGADFANLMSTQMTYFMPVLTIMIAWQLPAGLPLYWLVLTIFGIIQQYFFNRNKESRGS
jgi:YidC/Oxa1 family membrane protein insertase